jgi:hypothetical protein
MSKATKGSLVARAAAGAAGVALVTAGQGFMAPTSEKRQGKAITPPLRAIRSTP